MPKLAESPARKRPTPNPAIQPAAFNKTDAAFYAGMSVRTLEAKIAGGEIEARRDGRRIYIHRKALDGWLEGQPVNNPALASEYAPRERFNSG